MCARTKCAHVQLELQVPTIWILNLVQRACQVKRIAGMEYTNIVHRSPYWILYSDQADFLVMTIFMIIINGS